MDNYLLTISAILVISGCSWVDETGSQSSKSELQLDAGAALLIENEVFKSQISTQRSVQANFSLIAEGSTAAGSCNDYLPAIDSAASLRDACDLRVEAADCAIVFRVDDSANSTYSAKIPKLRQSVALKYNVESQDINGNKEDNELTLCLKAVNDAPEAEDHHYQVEYRTTLTTSDAEFDELTCATISGSGALKGATDDFDYASASLSGEPCLTASVVEQPTDAAEFSFSPLGGFSYSPKANLGPGASDSFTYIVNDGALDSDPKTVTITVVGDNDAPEILPIDTLVLDQNTSGTLPVSSLATDPEGERLNVSDVSNPAHGTTTQNAEGTELNYTPEADYIGEDSFSFTVQDIGGASAQGQVNVLVIRANQPPEIKAPGSLNYVFNNTAPSNKSFAVTVGDLETSPAQLRISATSSNGNVASVRAPQAIASDGSATVVLTPISNGTTTIALTVTDRGLSDPVERPAKSTTATVVVDIRGINTNSAPIASDISREVQQNNSLRIDLDSISSDPDDDSLRYSLITPPTGVTVSGSVLTIGRSSTQSIRRFNVTYQVSDGDKSDRGVITITVNEKPNAAPTAQNANQTVQPGDRATFDLNDLTNDTDAGDTLTFSLVTPPARVSLNNDTVNVITREADANSTITVRYQVSDGRATALGVLTVRVSDLPNTAPTIGNANQTVEPGSTASVDLATLAEDADNDTLSYTLLSAPSNARLSGTTLRVTTTAASANSTIRVNYRVSDGQATDTGVFTVTVSDQPNSPPTIANASASITAGESTSIDLATLANDADDDTLTYSIVSPVSGASISGSTLVVNTPDSAPDSVLRVSYRVSDGQASDTGVFTVNISEQPNNPPTIANASASITAGESASLDLATLANDADNDTLTYSIASPVSGASISGSTLVVRTQQTAADSVVRVTYGVSDGQASDTGVFTVTVSEAPNNPPTIANTSANITAGKIASVDLAALARDADNDTLTYSIVSPVSGASISGPTLTVSTQKSVDDSVVRVTYRVSDGEATDTGVLTVHVEGVPNNAPTTRDVSRSITAGQRTTLNLSSISNDLDDDPLTYSLSNKMTGVTLTGSTLTVITERTAATQVIAVVFNVTDGTTSVSGTLSVNVTAVASNTPPTAANATLAVPVGESVSLDLSELATDIEDGNSLAFSLQNPPAQASLANSIFTYTPAATDSSDTVRVVYTATDSGALSNSGTISIDVTAAAGG